MSTFQASKLSELCSNLGKSKKQRDAKKLFRQLTKTMQYNRGVRSILLKCISANKEVCNKITRESGADPITWSVQMQMTHFNELPLALEWMRTMHELNLVLSNLLIFLVPSFKAEYFSTRT